MAVAFVTVAHAARPVAAQGHRQPAHRPHDRPGRHRHPDRPGAAHRSASPTLLDGIDVVIVVVALFAIGEVFQHALKGGGGGTVEPLHGTRRDDRARTGGAPGRPGCAAPPSASRSARCRPAARRSRPSSPTRPSGGSPSTPRSSAQGAIEGVAGPEAANNAAAAGVLVPLLTIGLPTSATAAVILTAFQSYGLQPGPQLFSESGSAGLRAAGQPVRRQRDAARAEPAARAGVGAAAADPGLRHLRRHPGLRDARHLRAPAAAPPTCSCSTCSACSAC